MSGGSGALLARPLRLAKLEYRFLGSIDRSPLVGSPEGAHGAPSGAYATGREPALACSDGAFYQIITSHNLTSPNAE